MKFDNGHYHEGLRLTRNFLKKYPTNRIFGLIEADFLYKLKDYSKASDVFEEDEEFVTEVDDVREVDVPSVDDDEIEDGEEAK